MYVSADQPAERAFTSRRPWNDPDAHIYRSEWAQYPEGLSGSLPADRSIAQASSTYHFPWERQDGGVISAHPSGLVDWTNTEAESSEITISSSEHGRRDPSRIPHPDINYGTTSLPSGVPPTSIDPPVLEAATDADLFPSEFFVGAMRPRAEDACWPHLDPCMLLAQPSERVRVEAGPEHRSQRSEYSLAPPGPSASPSDRAAAAAETYFAIDYRGLCDQAAPPAPPNAGQVEQIMADLGIDFCANQAADTDASQPASSQGPFAQTHAVVSSAPLIPSQGGSPAAWMHERFAANTSSFPLQVLSQTQSSHGSIILPSLTASQSEYLGPNATSHRRTLDRTFSSATMALDSSLQTSTPYRRSPSPAGDFDEGLGQSIETSDAGTRSQEMSVKDATANFHKPHDLFLSHRAARNEEGGEKAARVGDDPHQSGPASTLQQHSRPRDPEVAEGFKKEAKVELSVVDAESAPIPPHPASTSSMITTISVADDRRNSASDLNDKGMDIDEPPLPEDAQQRNSSASIATSIVSGDQLQLVVDRFRVFAQLCQDHLHPSAEMLDCLASLIPEVVHTEAPCFHPKMICSQKVHSPEEAFALLSLASLRCDDPLLMEEGHRLICFLYGLVMLSYKHTLHLGGKLHSMLNCFLLVGMHSARQGTPDLWHKLEESRESILLDVLRAETRNSKLDEAMDRIDTGPLQGLPEEELFALWSRWYEHESRKRTLLLCAILDSQSSSYFSPLNLDLSAHPRGSRCQFLFAHVYEPCPDTVFFAWPPETWVSRLINSVSLPSAKGADIAFQDGQPPSIAACLTEQLLRPHVAHVQGVANYPRFRSSFDFGAGSCAAPNQHPRRSRSGDRREEKARKAAPVPFVEIADALSASTCSSRRQSQAERHSGDKPTPEARVVSQLYMAALLEGVHGAWMADSGWYQTAAWGTTALPERLDIDDEGFDADNASLADLPGWRIGRTLHATQVAHALMNWSGIFSGWNEKCQTSDEEKTAFSFGLKITDDTYQSTLRWQAIFLGLCVPLQSLCAYLDTSKRKGGLEAERHRKVSLLLRRWVDSAYCRRALVHASTILTLLCAVRSTSRHERLGPTMAHAAYTSLVALIGTVKLLEEQGGVAEQSHGLPAPLREELVPTRQVWAILLDPSRRDALDNHETVGANSAEASKDDGEAAGSEAWLRVRFWHRKFQFLGLAGIFRGHEEEGGYEVYADWRASVSAAAGTGTSLGSQRGAHGQPRWSSFVGEGRWPTARRETIHAHHMGTEDDRRSSHVADPDRDLLRWRLRSNLANYSASTGTRRWILQGATYNASFCGLPIWRKDHSQGAGSSPSHERRDADKVVSHEHLRDLVLWVRAEDSAWCFSQEYTSLLLGALREPAAAPTGAAAGNDQPTPTAQQDAEMRNG